ncbi:MAG: GatB/YqeY domain-containing protein [Chthoniobacterales bacterium]
MSLKEKVDADVKDAMRARAADRLGVLRMLKSALMNASIEKGGAGTDLDDAEAMAVVRKEVKKRQDSVAGFEKGGRPEMAEKERAEIEVLNEYLPEALSEEDLKTLVADSIAEVGATSRKDMGAVMKVANAKADGRADGKALSGEVQRQLA